MTLMRPATDKQTIVVVGGTGAESGYTVSSGASVDVVWTDGGAEFTLIRGRATLVAGPVPDSITPNEAGEPAGVPGRSLVVGRTIRTSEPGVAKEVSLEKVERAMNEHLFAFGVNQSAQWVSRAEQGDFTPVRAETTSTASAFGAQIGATRQTFDQPRTTITVPVGQGNLTRVQTAQVSQAQNLIGSQIPSSVVVGQRIRRSRIIGNPGTTGRGQIRFNPNAEPLLLLSGRPGSR